jgi:hypothetical protein
MRIVLDTNIWLNELALNSGAGSALRFHIKQSGAVLVLPEVVRLEVQRHLGSRLREWTDSVRKSHRQLLGIFGTLKEVVLPAEQEIDAVVGGVFSKLGVSIEEVPFSLESARSSFMKTILKEQPSDKTQQFKDGVIWADCLRLLETDDVLLATDDKAFYETYDVAKGLAANLRTEAEERSHSLTLVRSIDAVLERVRTAPSIDLNWFRAQVWTTAHSSVATLLEKNGVAMDSSVVPQVKATWFATEDPDRVYFSYSISQGCIDSTNEGRTDIALTARGDGSLTPSPPRLLEARPGEEALDWVGQDGSPVRHRSLYASANIVLGHATVSHSVRTKLG